MLKILACPIAFLRSLAMAASTLVKAEPTAKPAQVQKQSQKPGRANPAGKSKPRPTGKS